MKMASNGEGNSNRKLTYFATPGYVYSPPNPDGSIPTKEFVDASRGIVQFVAFFGTAFSPIKNDIAQNVTKLETVYNKDKRKNGTIQGLVENEMQLAKDGKMGYATEGLLWLKRGLQLIRIMLEFLVSDHLSGAKTENLVPIFRQAYEQSLKKHHNFIARQLFAVISSSFQAVTYRLYEDSMPSASHMSTTLTEGISLGNEATEDECIDDMRKYLPTFCATMDILVKYYDDINLEVQPLSEQEQKIKQTNSNSC